MHRLLVYTLFLTFLVYLYVHQIADKMNFKLSSILYCGIIICLFHFKSYSQSLIIYDTIINKGDSIKLELKDFRGQIQWEESLDAINWSQLQNGNKNGSGGK